MDLYRQKKPRPQLPAYEQCLVLALAQLTGRESLRDMEDNVLISVRRLLPQCPRK
jgi:hypothetical protein